MNTVAHASNWNQKVDSATRWFIYSAVLILILTAGGKLTSLTSSARILTLPDPLFSFVTNQHLLLLAAGLEIATVIGVFCLREERYRLALILWLSSLFVMYRLGLWWIGYKGYCGCLGHTAETLGITKETAESLTLGALVYLVVGAALFFARVHWRKHQNCAPVSGFTSVNPSPMRRDAV